VDVHQQKHLVDTIAHTLCFVFLPCQKGQRPFLLTHVRTQLGCPMYASLCWSLHKDQANFVGSLNQLQQQHHQ
jgi:hypothetical protein